MKPHSHVYTYKSLIYSPCKNLLPSWKAGTSDGAGRGERKQLCGTCAPWRPPPRSHLRFVGLSWMNWVVPSTGSTILLRNQLHWRQPGHAALRWHCCVQQRHRFRTVSVPG